MVFYIYIHISWARKQGNLDTVAVKVWQSIAYKELLICGGENPSRGDSEF